MYISQTSGRTSTAGTLGITFGGADTTIANEKTIQSTGGAVTIARSDGSSKVVAGYSGAIKSTNNSVNVQAPVQIARHSSTTVYPLSGLRYTIHDDFRSQVRPFVSDPSDSADTFEAVSGAFSLTAAVTLSSGSGAMVVIVRSATIAIQRPRESRCYSLFCCNRFGNNFWEYRRRDYLATGMLG